MGEIIETIKHRKKGSTLKWFIFMLLPFLNLYATWKLAELLASHGKATESHEIV